MYLYTYPDKATKNSTLLRRINTQETTVWEKYYLVPIIEGSILLNSKETYIFQMVNGKLIITSYSILN